MKEIKEIKDIKEESEIQETEEVWEDDGSERAQKKLTASILEVIDAVKALEESNNDIIESVAELTKRYDSTVRKSEQSVRAMADRESPKQDTVNGKVADAIGELVRGAGKEIAEVTKAQKEELAILERESRERRDRYNRAASRIGMYDKINTVLLLAIAALLIWKLFL